MAFYFEIGVIRIKAKPVQLNSPSDSVTAMSVSVDSLCCEGVLSAMYDGQGSCQDSFSQLRGQGR